MTTTPGETPAYSRPVYANQAAANGAVIDRFTEQLRRVRRALDYDRGKSAQQLSFETGYAEMAVISSLLVLQGLGLAAESRAYTYYAKDVPNG
jgi:hypothetical protein